MLTEATIGKVKYFPEQLPDSAVPTIAAGAEVSPIILELKQFPPLLVRLAEVATDQDDDVEMRFKVDNTVLNSLAGSMFDGLANDFSLLAKQRIYYNLYNKSGAPKADFKTFFSLWVIKPTVAHKLRLGITLTAEEQKLNRDHDIASTVEKGLLPLPLAQQIAREYQVLQEETHGFQGIVPTTAPLEIESLHPLNGEFLVLTKMSADPGTAAADNIRIAIDRDYEKDLVEFPTYALGTTAATALGKEISCFVPALHELKIKLKATVSQTINVRFTVWRCALTNIMRARWGLATRDELPGDVWEKVMAGVL